MYIRITLKSLVKACLVKISFIVYLLGIVLAVKTMNMLLKFGILFK